MITDQEAHKTEAYAHARLFFLTLEKTYGVKFSEGEQEHALRGAYYGMMRHMKHHRVFPRGFDAFKLNSFLGFHAAKLIHSTRASSPHREDSIHAVNCTVSRLSAVLSIDTSQQIKLDKRRSDFLVELMQAEVIGNCDVGIGPNGLSVLFAFLSGVRPDPEFLSKI